MSKVILENIQVLAAGQNIASDEKGKPQNVQVVTLLVTPEESQKLALASVDGKIQLSLRNPLDLARTNPDAVRREGLYGPSSAPPAAVEAKPAPRQVAVRTPRAVPPPAPVVPAPVAAIPTVAPTPKVEMQLIQGAKKEQVVFEQKVDVAGGSQ
jgi:pilus assembly protein CpaB